ncbi:MAG: hypothetical protein CVU44_10710 [Chloroflexi bacterium HGW-Chloroflexi-6]|nr:MAG: hypothetical protein CVU44_10710 [Chloroflexi bacterium HGW-Chloroflexi-6]
MKNFFLLIAFSSIMMGCTTAAPHSILEDKPVVTPTKISSPTQTPDALPKCPAEKEIPNLDFSELFDNNTLTNSEKSREIELLILDFLNDGGSPDSVINTFIQNFMQDSEDNEEHTRFFQKDITNDGIPELIIDYTLLYVFGCKEGKYSTVLKIDPGGLLAYSGIFLVQDMNLNGVPDLVINEWRGDINFYIPQVYRIMEWDGTKFKDLITQPDFTSRYGAGGAHKGGVSIDGAWTYEKPSTNNIEITDLDENGTQELILRGGLPTQFDSQLRGPWRAETNIYSWNGEGFVIYDVIPTPPEYRFQAIQDAEYAFFDEEYEKAIELYQDVISNDALKWWSTDQWFHESRVVMAEHAGNATPTPLPYDNSEYQYLSAYAHYRIMLIYAKQGRLSEANQTYTTLQENYPNGEKGYVTADLAAIFWNEFQNTQDIASSCSKAIAFADSNVFEIFNYVTRIKTDKEYDWIFHGWQKERDYVVDDICPFE